MKKILNIIIILFAISIFTLIVSCDWLSNSDDSNDDAVNTLEAPSNVNAEAVSSIDMEITWKDNTENEEGFSIMRSVNNTDFTEISSVSADIVSFTDSGLQCGINYYYKIKAFNSNASSEYSAAASAVTPCPPGNVLVVKAGAPEGGDGSSWTSAFSHPQDAVDAASEGDQVWIAEGTYTRKTVEDTVVLTMKTGVEIYGGFKGNEAVILDRDFENNITVFDGEDTAYHVVVGADNARIDGLKIIRGHTVTGDHGGGFLNRNCSDSLIIINCIIENNFASMRGGGMYNEGSSPIIINCRFINNTSWGGGAIANFKGIPSETLSAPKIINCMFLYNEANMGGAIYIQGSPSVIVINSTFFRNFEVVPGGNGHAFYNESDSLVIKNSILWNHHYTGPDQMIYNEGATAAATVTYSLIDRGMDLRDTPYPGLGNIIGLSGWEGYGNSVGWIYPRWQTYWDWDVPAFSASEIPIPEEADYHLSHISTGQDVDSPCIDAGDPGTSAEVLGILSGKTTRIDGVADTGRVDIGYHYNP